MWNRIQKWLRKLFRPFASRHFNRSKSHSFSGTAQFDKVLLEKYMIPQPDEWWAAKLWSVDENGNLAECLIDLGKIKITRIGQKYD